MKKIMIASAGAMALSLAACGGADTPAENELEAEMEATEDQADAMEDMADEADTEAAEENLDMQADQLEEKADMLEEQEDEAANAEM